MVQTRKGRDAYSSEEDTKDPAQYASTPPTFPWQPAATNGP